MNEQVRSEPIAGAEEWRPVVGFEGLYSVSSLGRVRSEARVVIRNDGRKLSLKTRILRAVKQDHHHGGHLQVNLSRECIGRSIKVHRLVIEAFVGPPGDDMECRHLDGDPTNNRVSNLQWGTHAENMGDTVHHGTSGRGSRSPRTKLTEADIVAIRGMHKAGASRRTIAERFGIREDHVGNICAGNIWRHVTEEAA